MIHAEAIKRALVRARIDYMGSDRVIHIHCPFHADQATPSLAIYTDREPHWYCYGCKRHGNWSDLATAIKAPTELEALELDHKSSTRLLRYLHSLPEDQPILPPGIQPWSLGPWRGFAQEVLAQLHSLWWYDSASRARRVLWPIWARDESLVGWTSRLLDKVENAPKYRNLTRMNALRTMWPWPTRNLEQLDRSVVVIVEGIPDTIRLLHAGVPTISNLGTAWSSTRTLMLADLEFKEVVVSCDGDPAGRAANLKIGMELRKHWGNKVTVWEWSDSVDPGDAPQFEVDGLIAELRMKPEPHPWLGCLPPLLPSWQPRASYKE